MRSIPVALNTELLKDAKFTCNLVELCLTATLYYTDLDVDVYYGGHQYVRRGMEVGDARYSLSPQVDKTTLSMSDVDGTFRTLIMTEEVRWKKATIFLAALTDYASVIAATVRFSGLIDSVKVNQKSKKAVFQILNPMVLWKRKTPRRISQPNCHWPFKSTNPETPCLYAGAETWCDQSYARCADLGNTAQFSGDRWLPSLQNRQIWWGKVPK